MEEKPTMKIKKTSNMAEYLREWRKTHPDSNKEYMKKYVQRTPSGDCECGGKYKSYAKLSHEKTELHQRWVKHQKEINELKHKGENQKIKTTVILKQMELKPEYNFKCEEVAEHFRKRFSDWALLRDADHKTPLVDKNSSIWKKVSRNINEEQCNWAWLRDNLISVIDKCYNTASSKQSALATIRLAMKEVGKLNDVELNVTRKLNSAFSQEHIKTSLGVNKIPQNQMSFREASVEAKRMLKIDKELGLYFKIHSGILPVIRLHDWINASTEDTGKNNWVILNEDGEGYMKRRISKNMKGEYSFKLPKELVKFLIDNDFKGQLFTSTANNLFKRLQKYYPDKVCNSRSFRTLYCSERIADIKAPSKLLETLEIIDHNVITFLQFYYKGNDALLNLLKTAKNGIIPSAIVRDYMATGIKEPEQMIEGMIDTDTEEEGGHPLAPV